VIREVCRRHPTTVELTPADLHHALDDAWARRQAGLERGAKEVAADNRGLASDWLGILGEMAFEQLWGDTHVCDVAYTGDRPDRHGWEVRCRAEASYDLYVKERDPDPLPLVLMVTHRLPLVCVAGVITAGRARIAGRKDGRDGWPYTYVRPEQLTPWSENWKSYTWQGAAT
jgi:hypothetical protein